MRIGTGRRGMAFVPSWESRRNHHLSETCVGFLPLLRQSHSSTMLLEIQRGLKTLAGKDRGEAAFDGFELDRGLKYSTSRV